MICCQCTKAFEAPNGFRLASDVSFRAEAGSRSIGLYCSKCLPEVLEDFGGMVNLELLIITRTKPAGGAKVDVLGLILDLVRHTRV